MNEISYIPKLKIIPDDKRKNVWTGPLSVIIL